MGDFNGFVDLHVAYDCAPAGQDHAELAALEAHKKYYDTMLTVGQRVVRRSGLTSAPPIIDATLMVARGVETLNQTLAAFVGMYSWRKLKQIKTNQNETKRLKEDLC